VGALAALIAALGALAGVREYRLKSAAQRVEIDVKLSKLLAEMVPIANGRGRSVVSDTAAEAIAQSEASRNVTPEEMKDALRGAVLTMPIGVATQAAAIASIGYLGGEHSALRSPAQQALLALSFVDDNPRLQEARKLALARVDRPY
jgi:hypothetical protein